MIPPRAPLPAVDPADYAARLAIIIPYRNREEHLKRILPHLVTFFERDRFARAIPYEVHIVEQAPGKLFNRGALINAGFHTKLVSFEADLVRNVRGAIQLLWGGVLLVLLIAVVNITNLSLVRATGRMKELATRQARDCVQMIGATCIELFDTR